MWIWEIIGIIGNKGTVMQQEGIRNDRQPVVFSCGLPVGYVMSLFRQMVRPGYAWRAWRRVSMALRSSSFSRT